MCSEYVPLSLYTAARADDRESLECFVESTLRAKIVSLDCRHEKIDLVANSYSLPHSQLWFCSYGVPLTLEFQESDYYRVQFHHKGQGLTRVCGREFEVVPQSPVMSGATAQIDFGANFQQTVLRVSRANLLKKISHITGSNPSNFKQKSPFDRGMPDVLRHAFDGLLKVLEMPMATVPELILAEFEDLITTTMAYTYPGDFLPMLEREQKRIAPWQVLRIESYIEAHWDKPITIEDLVSVVQCSARSIFRTFKDARGYSPMEFVKQVRLRNARKMLCAGVPNISVTQVALACGFVDLGRFSRDYALSFGELPSATLKKRRSMVLIEHA